MRGYYILSISSYHQLSLAQLEERKTVTVVSNALKCHLEARGSIPRGETLLLPFYRRAISFVVVAL
jgi:hypothetical protein